MSNARDVLTSQGIALARAAIAQAFEELDRLDRVIVRRSDLETIHRAAVATLDDLRGDGGTLEDLEAVIEARLLTLARLTDELLELGSPRP